MRTGGSSAAEVSSPAVTMGSSVVAVIAAMTRAPPIVVASVANAESTRRPHAPETRDASDTIRAAAA